VKIFSAGTVKMAALSASLLILQLSPQQFCPFQTQHSELHTRVPSPTACPHTPIKPSTYHTALFPYDSLSHKRICQCLNPQHKTRTCTTLPGAQICVYNAIWNGFPVTYTERAFRLQLLLLLAHFDFQTKKRYHNCNLFCITLFQYTYGNFFLLAVRMVI